MGKKNQKFAKIYREFTRIKYQKYRLQYPRVRESELIAKILKQWEGMDENAKENLEKQYIERSGKGFLQDSFIENPSSSSKEKQEKANEKTKVIKKKKPSPKTQVFQEKKPSPKVHVIRQLSSPRIHPNIDENNDFKPKQKENSKSPGKKSTPEKSSSNLNIATGRPAPKKAPGKKQDEYQSFFKYYYDRLTAEHPRWNVTQINTIIKLLWKKRISKSTRKQRTLENKKLSGRQLYSRVKLGQGLNKDQIRQLWKALPHESKKYWQIRGQGRPQRSLKDSGRYVRKVLGCGISKEAVVQSNEQATLNWLNKNIAK